MNTNERIEAAKTIIAKIEAHRVEKKITKALKLRVWAKGDHVRVYSDTAKHGYIGIDRDGNMIDPIKTAKSDLYSYAVSI